MGTRAAVFAFVVMAAILQSTAFAGKPAGRRALLTHRVQAVKPTIGSSWRVQVYSRILSASISTASSSSNGSDAVNANAAAAATSSNTATARVGAASVGNSTLGTQPAAVSATLGTTTAGTSAAASACDASSLPAYTSSMQLSSDLTLHWKAASATKVNLALEAAAGSTAAAGWFSLAWSADGRMAPADTVFGNLPGGAVAAYYMSGYGMSDVQPTSSFSIGNTVQTTSASGSTIIKFSRVTGDGSIPVNVGGSNTLIWAYSESGSQSLDFHGENDYTYSIQLDSALTLHWKTASATKVNLALEAAAGSTAAAGWFSLAWTADGRMAPADTIIGNLPGGAVASYYMSGYGMSDVQPTSSFSIGSGATLATSGSGSKVM
ncbi:hypothetical protein CLOP_g25369, partial [Closterium sp. NIES-67]